MSQRSQDRGLPAPDGSRNPPDENFVYVTDDGAPIDLAMETSYLMAMGLQEKSMEAEVGSDTGATDHENNADATNDDAPDDAGATPDLAAADVDGFLSEMPMERWQTDEFLGADPSPIAEDEAGGAPPTAGDGVVEEKHEEEEQGEEEGMDAWGSFSREYSDARGNDEWELQAIVRRRVVARRETALEDHGAGGDYDDAETAMLQRGGGRTAGWGGGKKAAKGRALDAGTSARGPAKEQQYLCQWRWYGEMTWEPRAVLEELGFKQQCDQHDAAIALATESSARKAHLATTGQSGQSHNTRLFVENLNSAAIERNLNRLFSELPHRLAGLFHKAGLQAVSFSYIANRAVVERFFRLWSGRRGATPVLVFHGTRSVCCAPIVERGLAVPGENGVRVINGAVHGQGIYTAKEPGLSRYYSSGSQLMFVCIGLMDTQVVRFQNTSMIVFNRSDAVFPSWLVHYRETAVSSVPSEVPLNQLPGFSGQVNEKLMQERRLPTMGGLSLDTTPTSHWGRTRMSKKMLKQAPRFVKELYRAGDLRPKK